MKRIHLYAGIAALVVLILVIGLFTKSARLHEGITLGAPFILSGDFTTYGDQARNAANLAVADFENTHPNTKVNIIFEDTHADPKQAVSAYRKLVDIDHVDAIVGPMLQTEMGAIEPMVKQDNVPLFSVAPLPQQDRSQIGNPLVLWPDPTHEAEQMAVYVYGQGTHSIGILGTQDAWESEVAKAFAKKFTALGGTVTNLQLTLSDASDTRLEVTKVVTTQPQAIFLPTYYKFFDFVTEARQMGYAGRLFSIEIDTNLAAQAKKFADGLQFISPNFYNPDYVNRYNAKFGIKPTLPSGQVYDATMLALTTLYQNHSRSAVLDEMQKMTSYNGVSGIITFDQNHLATFPLSIFEIQKGIIAQVK